MASTILYSSSSTSGAATQAQFERREEERGMVPYFVSGPLSRKYGLVGLIGTLVHVAMWLLAVVFDFMAGTKIDEKEDPMDHAYWVSGYATLLVSFVVLLVMTVYHLLASPANKIPEGGAPPFLMALLIGGARISFALTMVNIISSIVQFEAPPASSSPPAAVPTDRLRALSETDAGTTETTAIVDNSAELRTFLILAMICKGMVVQFLQSNQDWAGPAEAIRNYL